MRAWEAGEIYLTDYIHTVAAFNPKDQLRYYPGSPSFLAHTARPQDKIVVNEKHPDEAAALRHVFARDKQVSIHERDGYEVWQALTPPKTPRGVVFIDPPFEQTNEFSQIAKTLIATHKKWSHGVVFIWFPIKDRGTLTRFYDTLAESGIPKILLAEHLVYNTERAGRLNGSGIIVVNAPYQFTQELPLLLNAVQNSIKATDEAGKTVIRWISDEA